MYKTKRFPAGSFDTKVTGIDEWLNSLQNPYIVGYVSHGSDIVITIIERPHYSPHHTFSPMMAVEKSDIDQAYEEKSIE